MNDGINNTQIDTERLIGLERELRELRSVFERIYVLMWWFTVGFFGVVGSVILWYFIGVILFPAFLIVGAVLAIGFGLRWLFDEPSPNVAKSEVPTNGIPSTSSSRGA